MCITKVKFDFNFSFTPPSLSFLIHQLTSEDEGDTPPQPIDKTDFVPMLNQSPLEASNTSKTDGSGAGKLPMRDRGMTSLHYLVWTTEFIHKESELGDWIEEHGSWVSFFFSP